MVDVHQQIDDNDAGSSAEKRVFSRVECFVDLEVESQEGIERVEAIDLSLLGLGFSGATLRNELRAGQRVRVAMSGLRPVLAQVRWQDGSRVGVQFCGRFHDIVESWVGEVLSAQGVKVQDLFCYN